jgi:hypothetical protein
MITVVECDFSEWEGEAVQIRRRSTRAIPDGCEAKRLINAAEPDFRLLVQAALQTGARYGEHRPQAAMRLGTGWWPASAGPAAMLPE